MSTIDIVHPHAAGLAKARKAVEEVAGKLAAEYALECHWQGDSLHFKRSGVHGRIGVGADSIHVQARLGLLYSELQATIETEIRRMLDKKLGQAPTLGK